MLYATDQTCNDNYTKKQPYTVISYTVISMHYIHNITINVHSR